ncbi:MAG: branched-chain amino acid transaminase [Nitrospinota bacterium]|jgi:branched-chain amino acid aminotransferase|nr:branched-chain amino acid transaminase [Nitrospinota bacterium]HJM42187.1 branched-chain amino acid transaminase [Nitrospinota bacterium]
MKPVKEVWMDGAFVPWDDANVHILTQTLHYGMGVFEGIRCYETVRGSAIFRFREHMDRLYRSAHIVRIDPNIPQEELSGAIPDLIGRNSLSSCYIRPIIYLGLGEQGLAYHNAPVQTAAAVWEWGAYMGDEGVKDGIRVKVSSFTHHPVNSTMLKSKTCGNYVVSMMARMEALQDGYDEALMLDPGGMVAQGPGENVFIVRNGILKTPSLAGVLEGITRDSVMRLAEAEGLEVREEPFARDDLYIADEAFFVGTAVEVTPIREVDNRTIGSGRPGPVTQKLQEAFFRVVRGEDGAYDHWLTPV